MNYTKVKKLNTSLKMVLKKIDVLLINNPCSKKDFPEEVNRNYFCKNQRLNDDEVFIVDGKLAIGLFYEAKKCQKADIKKIEANEITGRFCAFKNDIPLEEMNIGMGDILLRWRDSHIALFENISLPCFFYFIIICFSVCPFNLYFKVFFTISNSIMGNRFHLA